ncbi:MAG: hypothetical protein HY961_14525 [Ignavibacteriae bacterium]|nr:hypothetical protein [Ignavibacteriota bacterium]
MMNHIDEHTLELYVLGSAKVAERRQGIESHLVQCFGCRETVERMSAFYKEVNAELAEYPTAAESQSQALMEIQRRVPKPREPDLPAVPLRPVTRLQRFQYFVRRHPVMSGGGTFAALAGLAMLFSTTTTFFKEDNNPHLINYNVPEKRIEILNRKYEKLWSFPSESVERIKGDYALGLRQEIAVYDLDGDGKNDVLSTRAIPEDQSRMDHPFRVFDASGNIKQKYSFAGEIHYLQRTYSDRWSATLFVIDSSNRTNPSLIVAWGGGRSPGVITRLNRKLEIVGEYWHFGMIAGMRLVDLNDDGKPELVFSGQNEALDSVRGEFPAFAILDPSKIVGRGMSSTTPGFAMPESQAELSYVGLPVSSISVTLDVHETVKGITNVGARLFSCWVEGAVYENLPVSFEYIFSRDLRVVEVKSANGTDAVHRLLVNEGKLSGKLDAAYRENLKNGVRYWDGKEWRKYPVSINARFVRRDEESNPSYHLYNPSSRAIEIRTSNHRKLWELPSAFVTQALIDYEAGTTPQTAVADLDGDGYNEVLTTLPIGAEHSDRLTLSIYDAWKNLKFEREFSESFQYLQREYSPRIGLGPILVRDGAMSGKKEIWISGNSFHRSPNVILRLDANANIIGKYWHFGQIYGMYALDLENDGKTEIVLVGINDVDDTTHHEFAALAVLDPTKVVGETRSTTAPGFVMPPSTAELYYVGFPHSDMDTALKTNPSIVSMRHIESDALHFTSKSRLADSPILIAFDYILHRDMSMREVKSNNETDRLHTQLVEQGKVKGRVDAAYLKNLKDGVRYWDGKEWRREVVRITPRNQLSMVNGQ